jgi:sugar lactone lactonase YvrE
MKRFLKILGVLLALAIVYLLVWPTPVDPVAWEAPAAPAVKPTGSLAAAERIRGAPGPEATTFDAAGTLYTGLVDGRIVRLGPDRAYQTFADTGGRPLGMAFDAAGRLIVADARKGLLAVDPAGKISVLVDASKLGFTDDVAIAADGTIYFSDASVKYGYGQDRLDIVEHRPNGRVYAFRDGALEVVADKLHFANGTALAADGSYLLINETGSYRVVRLWLAGARRGTVEPFAENLPGFPDNITRSPRGGFWVAIYSPRVAIVDRTAPYPFLRKMMMRLPEAIRPKPVPHGMVLHLDEQGKLDQLLVDDSPTAYSPITSCLERDGKLWLGSLSADGVAVMAAP